MMRLPWRSPLTPLFSSHVLLEPFLLTTSSIFRCVRPAQRLGCWLSLYALADIPFSVETIEDDDEQEFWEIAIAQLQKLHLIQWQAKGIYRLHPLIRQFFQMKLDELSDADKVKTAFVAQMAEVAKQIPQQPNREDIFNLTPHIPHLAEVATHLSQYLSDEDLIGPFTGLGWFYQGQGLYQQAEPWVQQCVKIAENRLSLEHLNIAASLNNRPLAKVEHPPENKFSG
ncbi:hypothetical protein LC653_28565 [Nostoc sp. CHAB 5784]|nr:hypothetical protein [Nostoc mirabile CHAB5784]